MGLVVREVVTDATVDALTSAVHDQNIPPAALIAVLQVEAPGGTGMGGSSLKFRVLYWEDPKTSP